MTGTPSVASIILAAGRSTRMGAANKLLAEVQGRPMVRVAAEAVLASRARPVLVVTGHQGSEVRVALAGLDLAIVENSEYATGLSSSLKAGLRALPPGTAGALVVLGDMPRIPSALLDGMIGAFAESGGKAIVVPVHGGRRGNPVLWPAACFPEILRLSGDEGARQLFARHTDMIAEIEAGTDAIFADVDTPEALAALRASVERRPLKPSRAC